jgi:hypothetical protein
MVVAFNLISMALYGSFLSQEYYSVQSEQLRSQTLDRPAFWFRSMCLGGVPPDFSSRRSQMNYARGGCVASSGSQDGKIAPVFVISRRAQRS